MIHVCVTGATGYIGKVLVDQLIREGYFVHALYRNFKKVNELNIKNIKLFKGDLKDCISLVKAFKNCDCVFHTAALASARSVTIDAFYTTNVIGTRNVMHAAIQSKVRRVVIISTAGVLNAEEKIITEEHSLPKRFFSAYEATKYEADKVALNTSNTVEVIITYPTRVFGPGPLSESGGVNRLINLYLNGKWHIIPGSGKAFGNYVFIEDLVKGLILAYKKGQNRERYILGGDNLSYNQLFREINQVSGNRHLLINVPKILILPFVWLLEVVARLTSLRPPVSTGIVNKLFVSWSFSIEKANHKLDYQPMPFKQGLELTIKWLQEQQID